MKRPRIHSLRTLQGRAKGVERRALFMDEQDRRLEVLVASDEAWQEAVFTNHETCHPGPLNRQAADWFMLIWHHNPEGHA